MIPIYKFENHFILPQSFSPITTVSLLTYLSAQLIFLILPLVIFHLPDHLELIIMGGSFLLELFLFFNFLLFFLIFHIFILSKISQLFFQLLVQLIEIDFFMCVDLLVMFGYLQVVVDFDLLCWFWLLWGFVLGAAFVLVAFCIWGFGLVNFLIHASGFLCLFKLLLVPDNTLTWTMSVVGLLLHLED